MDDTVTLTFDYGTATFTANLTLNEARYLITHINNKLDALEAQE